MNAKSFDTLSRGALSLLLTCCCMVAPAWGQSPQINWDLDDALRQVDRQADNFGTAMSRVNILRTNSSGEEVLNETGNFFINERGDIRIDIEGDEPLTYLLKGKYLYIHKPAQQLVEQYYLKKHPTRLEPFMRQGFTLTGRDLEDGYLMTAIGERAIGSSRSLGLDLTPRKESARTVVAGIKLWIDQASWMPSQQQVTATQSGEQVQVSYTQTARNLKLNPDLFKDKWPRGTKKKKM